MASKLSGWIDEAVGAAMIVAGVFCPPLAPYLIAAGSGLILSGIGTLIEGLGAVHGAGVMSRNPVKSWDVVYGRSRVSGTTIYLNEWGNNNKYIDIVAVLACHPCRDVYAVLFNGRMVQIDTTAVPAGVPASTWPAINGGTSFSPLQETHNIAGIARANNVVTVVVQDIPLLVAGEYIIVSGVTTDATLNGTWPVSQIVRRAGGNITFQYLCGGHAVTIGAQGSVSTEWVDYGRHVYVEVMLGTQTLGTTFVGMTIGTPNEGDPTDLQHPSTNPWSANCSAVGRTVVFLRLNYDSNIFANGIPEISFLVHGKNNITDPRTTPATVGYSENPALIFADYMTDQNYGFRCALGTEINVTDLATDANICDEAVALAAGGTEPRYMCNGRFELSISRGQILQSILSSCGGRLTNAAGTFRCNPAAWAGVGELISGTGTGFTARVTAVNSDGLETFDAIAPAADSMPYPGTVTWPGCNVINWAALLAFKPAAGETPAFVQGIGNASAPGTPTFNTWTLAFAANNTAGNMLLVDVAFGTGYPLAGASVTDSQGNTYKPVLGGHVLGSSAFLMCFVAVDCAGGANTVTVTQTGDHGFNFQDISMAVHEYAGMSTSLPSGTPPVDYGSSYTDPTGVCDAVSYGGGPAADSLTPSVTVSQDGDLLHLIAATLPNCSGLIVSGGATPITPLAMAAGPFRWKSKVSVRDLFNAVKGTYISPASNWQASDFPPYMQDTLHGYYSGGSPMDPFGDANLAADDGERRYLDIQLPFTISVAAAQRLAKIELLRRRYQGNGTFVFNLGGLQVMALDVVAMTLPYFNWTGKLLEVLAFRFTLSAKQNGDTRVIALATEIDVKETDPSIYEWSISEELTPQGYQQGTIPNPQNIASPTSLVLLSNSTTAVVSAQGVSSSRIEVSWTAPADAYIAEVQIQYQLVASPQSTVWTAGPSVPVNVTTAFIGGVVDGTNYYVQVRGVAASGIASAWVQAGPVTVAGSSSQLFTVNGS